MLYKTFQLKIKNVEIKRVSLELLHFQYFVFELVSNFPQKFICLQVFLFKH